MADAEVVPATPEEYRGMLDEIGLFTAAAKDGFDAVMWRGMRSFRLAFRRAENGWWEMHTVSAFGTLDTLLWVSAHTSDDTREFITNWVASYDPRKRKR